MGNACPSIIIAQRTIFVKTGLITRIQVSIFNRGDYFYFPSVSIARTAQFLYLVLPTSLLSN